MIGLLPTLRAERIRTHRSAAAYLPLLGVVIAGISIVGTIITPESQERAALLWQTLYVTGMATPLMALLAGLVNARERVAREGGTTWRAVSSRKVIVARFAVLAALSGAFHAIAFWTVIPVSVVAGTASNIPALFWAGVVCWAATLGVLAVSFVLSERWGVIPVFIGAWVWQLIGTLASESAWWPVIPPAWAVRAMLPILGAHQNATPLAPGDPLLSESPALALSLCLAMAVVVIFVRVFSRVDGSSEVPTSSRPVGRRNTRPGALGALASAMRSRPILPLCAGALTLSAVTAVVYSKGYLLGLYTYAVQPLGACIVAALAWQTLAPGWRVLVIRRHNLPSAVQIWLLLLVSGVSLAVTLLTIASAVIHDGAGPSALGTVASAGALWLVLGSAGVFGALWIVVRFGTGWALGAVAVLVIVSATLGGDVLANTWLWVLAPAAWPLSADTPARFLLALTIGLGLCAITWILSNRALRKAASRGV